MFDLQTADVGSQIQHSRPTIFAFAGCPSTVKFCRRVGVAREPLFDLYRNFRVLRIGTFVIRRFDLPTDVGGCLRQRNLSLLQSLWQGYSPLFDSELRLTSLVRDIKLHIRTRYTWKALQGGWRIGSVQPLKVAYRAFGFVVQLCICLLRTWLHPTGAQLVHLPFGLRELERSAKILRQG